MLINPPKKQKHNQKTYRDSQSVLHGDKNKSEASLKSKRKQKASTKSYKEKKRCLNVYQQKSIKLIEILPSEKYQQNFTKSITESLLKVKRVNIKNLKKKKEKRNHH